MSDELTPYVRDLITAARRQIAMGDANIMKSQELIEIADRLLASCRAVNITARSGLDIANQMLELHPRDR